MNAKDAAGVGRSASRAESLWQREALAAATAMMVAVPAAIANGLVMFAPLGPGFTGVGALAGVVGAAVLGTIAAVFGGTPGLVSAPSPAAAAFMAVVATQLVMSGHPPADIVAQLAVVGGVAGVIQVVIGTLRGGRFVKYLPYPVIAGYLTGGGLLILHLQLGKLVGAPSRWGALQVLSHPGVWRFVPTAIATATVAVALLAPRVTKKIPATLLGLGAGVLVHQLLAVRWPELRHLHGNPLVVGPVLRGAAPNPLEVVHVASNALSLDIVQGALVPGAILGALLSIDTLKTCLLVDGITRARHDSDRELIAQGVGNAVSALFGGAPGTGIVSGSMVNVSSGARTRWSGAVAGVLALVVLVALGPALAWMPVPALAAIVALMAWRMLQGELVQLVRDRTTLVDFVVAATVIGVAIAMNLAAAAAVGVLLAVALFLIDHARVPVVRRILDGALLMAERRSGRERNLADAHAPRILVVELQGSLFFGTADRLAVELAPALDRRGVVILDLARVRSIDVTAVNALKPIAARLAERGGRLVVCQAPGAEIENRLRTYIERLGLTRGPARLESFPHVDDALEWAEEQLGGGTRLPGPPLALEEIDLFRSLPANAVEALRSVVRDRSAARGECIMTAGEVGRELFFIRSGEVRVVAPADAARGERPRILATLGAGEVLGDLAYLDGGARSADVIAVQEVQLFVLGPEDVAQATMVFPGLDTLIAARLALAIADRLRRATADARRLRAA